MSQPPASVSLPQTPVTTPSGSFSNIESIFDAALKSYKKKTKKDLKNHSLFKQLESCDSPATILAVFQSSQFDRTGGDDRLKKWLVPTINVLYAFSAALGEGVGLVFSPAKVVFAGVGVLLLAAKGVAESHDILVDVFGRIGSFFERLEIYTGVPLTPTMTEKMVQITVEILDILATATMEMKQNRAKKFLKKLAGRTDLEDGVKKLEKLIIEEIAMASAQLVKVTDDIDNKVTEVVDGVRGVDENVHAVKGEVQLVKSEVQLVKGEVQLVNNNVQAVDDKVQTIAEDGKATAATATELKSALHRMADVVNAVEWNQLRESLRRWQSPPDPSTNHGIAGDRQHAGTAEWFIESDKFKTWKVAGSLLWIHGKAGSGKSILCSAIIKDVTTLRNTGSASMAYFYFDFQDVDKQARRNLLPSLLVQLSNHSDAFCEILFRLYETHDNGACRPSDKALMQCLRDMLTLPNQDPVYLILDALDECPDTSDVPSPREQVLNLIKELVDLRLPSLHICATSRPEVDIGDVLESIASQTVSLQDERGQKKDIVDYVRSVVYSDSGKFMKRWRKAEKEHVIETLSERADGMFRWVYCQLEVLRNCLPQNVRRILRDLPNSLDETYERTLKEIGKVNPDQAYRLLQCLAVATRPLNVDELAEVLALDFDEIKEGIPALKKDWRWDDQRQGVLSTCSSLIVVVNDQSSGTRVVQFAHFSVKEFLTSDRLAHLKADISRFHICLEPAHTILAQACLAILLQPYDNDGAKSDSPLSNYATWCWVDHARFENVSSYVEHGMRRLFHPDKPYFKAWLKSYSIDSRWPSFEGSQDRSALRPAPTPSSKANASLCLYYAALCGFRDLTEHLIAEYPQHINARIGRKMSPLAAALRNRHLQVAELLHQHGAVLSIGYLGRTLLHAASNDGLLDVAQWLLNIGADANAQDLDHATPLHLAAANGRLELARTLLKHSVDVNAVATTLFNPTPLHEASIGGHVDTVRLLVQNGANVNAGVGRSLTPLHMALSLGNTGVVRVLIERADVNARDRLHRTPMHLVSNRTIDAVPLLIQHGADVNARDEMQRTPLHLASSAVSSVSAVRQLIKCGAGVNAYDGSHKTPLHRLVCSQYPNVDSLRLLLENGADVDAEDDGGRTPFQIASSKINDRHHVIAQLLSDHRARVVSNKM